MSAKLRLGVKLHVNFLLICQENLRIKRANRSLPITSSSILEFKNSSAEITSNSLDDYKYLVKLMQKRIQITRTKSKHTQLRLQLWFSLGLAVQSEYTDLVLQNILFDADSEIVEGEQMKGIFLHF